MHVRQQLPCRPAVRGSLAALFAAFEHITASFTDSEKENSSRRPLKGSSGSLRRRLCASECGGSLGAGGPWISFRHQGEQALPGRSRSRMAGDPSPSASYAFPNRFVFSVADNAPRDRSLTRTELRPIASVWGMQPVCPRTAMRSPSLGTRTTRCAMSIKATPQRPFGGSFQQPLRSRARIELVGKLSTLMFAVSSSRHKNALSCASNSEWPRLSRAGGTIIKTTVDHALMRGLDTAGPVMRRGASSV